MVVRSKRGVLLRQAVFVFALAATLGWVVERWDLLPMSRLSDRWGLPVALLFFAGVGFLKAKVSAVIKKGYGCEIGFPSKALDVGVNRFLEELGPRLKTASGANPT